MQRTIQRLLNQKMDRAQFLRTLGVFSLGVIGFANLNAAAPGAVTRVRTSSDSLSFDSSRSLSSVPRKFGS